jgi:hypothetical protein
MDLHGQVAKTMVLGMAKKRLVAHIILAGQLS